MGKEIRVGLIGYGMAGRVFHAPTITSVPDLKLVKVVERNREQSKERYPWVEIVRTPENLFEDPDIDLVVVATPNDSHYDLAKRALLAGKHVVVEKPFANTSEEAAELVQISKQQNKVLSVYHNRRWDGDFMTIQKLLKEDFIGDVVDYAAHWDRYHNQVNTIRWRESGGIGTGILYDLGSHLIDQALVLFGVPEWVSGDARILREGAKSVDFFEVSLGYEKQKVTVQGSMLVREESPRYIIHGRKGSYVKYGIDPQEDALKAGGTPKDAGWGKESPELWGKLNTEMNGLHVEGKLETLAGAYQGYYQNIYDAIVGAKQLVVQPEQVVHTIKIIEMAMQSSEQKKILAYK